MPNASAGRPLNPRQRLFVEHYLIDLNGKEAAIRAGYAPEGAAVRAAKLLRRPSVRGAVAAAMAARAARSATFFAGGITAERVIAEYEAIAFADIRHFAVWGPKGMRFASSRRLSPAETRLVGEIAEGANGVRRVRLFDKQAALNSLARILANAGRARFRLPETNNGANAATDHALSDLSLSDRPLSERQRRFADEFLKDFDASAAARRAGYALKSAPFLATKLRRYPGVAARIAAGIEARRVPIRAEADRVLAEYARIAFADIGRIADWDNKALRLKPKRRVAVGDSAAIATLGSFGSGSGAPGARLRLQLHDKVYALDMLAQHLGLLDPRMPGRALTRKWPAQRTSAALRQRLGHARSTRLSRAR
jgi:phage terminase small subunit